MKLPWHRKLLVKMASRAMTLAGSTLANPEAWLIQALYGTSAGASPIHVDENSAMSLPAVYSCIRFLSETVASLPLHAYKEGESGDNEKLDDLPEAALLSKQPNPFMTAMLFRETLMGHCVGWGNGYAEIERDGSKRPVALWPLAPNRVKPRVVAPGRMVYEYTDAQTGQVSVFQPYDIIHVPGLSFDGLRGYSPIALARRALGLSYGAQEFGARFYENDARPGVALKHPHLLSDKAYERLKKTWQDEHGGVQNAWRPRILEEGMDIATIGIPQADAQFIETRKFGVLDTCRLFRVAPHFIFDLERATFGNIEQQSLELVIFNLRPWLVRFEQEFNRKLFLLNSGVFCLHNVEGLLRGDYKSRMEGYGIGIERGIFRRNEVRRLENFPTLDEKERGDETTIPVNWQFASDVPTKEEKKAQEDKKLEAQKQTPAVGTMPINAPSPAKE